MNTHEMIDISGLDKAAVLATLFNASAPAGMGFLQAGNGPVVMTIDDAQQLITEGSSPDLGSRHHGESIYFDYLFGRPLKLDLTNDEFSPWGFDRDNGGAGTAQRLIDELRSSGDVDSDELRIRRQAQLIENRDATMEGTLVKSEMIEEGVFVLGASDVAAPLLRNMDRETERFIRKG